MFKKILLSISLILFAMTTYAYEISSWQVLNNSTLPTRENPGVITYNGQIYVVAGYNATDGYFNDVWRSSNGINWYANTRNAQFEGRTNMAVYNHNNRLWVVGGTNTSTAFADAWYSTNNGVSWSAATRNAQYLPRTSFWGYTTHKGYMYFTSGNVSGTYPKEVWRSSNGVSWEGVTLNASFDGGEYGALVSDGTDLYQFGGYSTVVGDVTNKVWKSTDDGITWTLLGTANWSARQGFAHGYLNGRIWVNSGYGASTYYKDTWYSDDWINWTQDLDALNTMTNLGSTIFLNKWLTIGGYNGTTYDNNVIMANIPLGTSTATGTPTYTPTSTNTFTYTNTSTYTNIVSDTPTNTATVTPIWTQQSSIIVSNLTPQLTQIPYPTGIVIISEPTPEWTQPIPLATIWVSMINWPTLVPTLTATGTATQTPTAAITPYATYQPIIRYVASESDGYKNGMKIEFNKVTGTGDYSGIIYNLRVKDLMYPNNIYSINLSNSIDAMNALSGWITYDLTNLRYDYCYEIYLDINHPSWAATISATPITLCPYETPTPFAGTPTATNSPDCTVATATPSPAITIAVTVGYVIYETNEGATPTDSYSGGATHSGGTWTYQGLTRNGDVNNIAVRSDSNGSPDYLSYRTYTSDKLVVSAWVYRNNNAINFISGGVWTAKTNDAYATSRLGAYRGDGTCEQVFDNTTKQLGLFGATFFNLNWTYVKGIYGIKDSSHAEHIFWDETNKKIQARMVSNFNGTFDTNYWGSLYSRLSSEAMYFDDWSICKTVTVTAQNLPDKATLVIYDASNNTLTCKMAGTSGEVQWDTTEYIYPVICKFAIYSPGGLIIYADADNRQVFGGDVYPLITPTP